MRQRRMMYIHKFYVVKNIYIPIYSIGSGIGRLFLAWIGFEDTDIDYLRWLFVLLSPSVAVFASCNYINIALYFLYFDCYY